MSRSEALVDAEWVEAHGGDPGVVLVEVDEDTSAYEKGHIPNAIRIDWKQDLQDPVRRDFVDRIGFEKLLSERGISNDDTVVLYGGNNNWFAAYAYWYFKLYGHHNVKLLDGGRKKWELESRELTRDVPNRPATTYKASEQDASLRAKRDEVLDAIGKRNLVDVRSPDEFAGRLLAPAHLPHQQSRTATDINDPTAEVFAGDIQKHRARAAREELCFVHVRRDVPELADLLLVPFHIVPDWLGLNVSSRHQPPVSHAFLTKPAPCAPFDKG